MEKKDEKKQERPCCPACGSRNTYVSNKPKQGPYIYCNHCGHEEWMN